MGYWYDYKPYVPVARRRAQAAKEVARRLKKGETVSPVVIEGRTIASTFWGKAWCTNLEGYSDFENRLPRGRTYVRNGSVVDLKIDKGRVQAFVSGSELYTVEIQIASLPRASWEAVKKRCAGKIGSIIELLQGKLSNAVMEAVTNRAEGLFPKPKEITMRCSCPDYAGMCKHIAAVMYGIGNRLDTSPELLFGLRGVDHQELIEQAIPAAPTRARRGTPTIEASDLGAIFEIELGDTPAAEPTSPRPKSARAKASKPKKAEVAAKPAAVKTSPRKKAATQAAATKKPAAKAKAAATKAASAKPKAAAARAKATKAKKSVPASQKRKAATEH